MKARLVFAAKEINPGKLQALDDLHAVFVPYAQVCVNVLIQNRTIDFSDFDHNAIVTATSNGRYYGKQFKARFDKNLPQYSSY